MPLKSLSLLIFLLLTSAASVTLDLEAELDKDKVKKLIFIPTSESKQKTIKLSFTLSNQAKITIDYIKDNHKYANALPSQLERQLKNFEKTFGQVPKFKLTIKLLDQDSFFKITGAPAWTNALYLKNYILLPIKSTEDQDTLFKTLNHEFAHALTGSLTNHNCPGWIDEGIAQWAEEQDSNMLRNILADWIIENPLIEFDKLENGFTQLENRLIPVAYAQSLLTLQILMENGYQENLNKYLKEITSIKKNNIWEAIRISQLDLEKQLLRTLTEEIDINQPTKILVALN